MLAKVSYCSEIVDCSRLDNLMSYLGVASRLSGYCWGSRCYRSNAHARMTFLNKFVNVIRAANG